MAGLYQIPLQAAGLTGSLDIQHVLKVPLEKMLKLIRTRPTTQSHTLMKERRRQPPLPNSCPGSDPGNRMVGPHLRRLWHGTFQNKQRCKRQALHRRLLKHRLLLAVIPWVGDINLACTQAAQKPATVQTQGTAQSSLENFLELGWEQAPLLMLD